MPSVTRLADLCTGHDCYPSRPNITASENVFVNLRGAHREADVWDSHCCGDCHLGYLMAGSRTVYVNNRQLCRIGDPVDCGSLALTGSGNVFAGPAVEVDVE